MPLKIQAPWLARSQLSRCSHKKPLRRCGNAQKAGRTVDTLAHELANASLETREITAVATQALKPVGVRRAENNHAAGAAPESFQAVSPRGIGRGRVNDALALPVTLRCSSQRGSATIAFQVSDMTSTRCAGAVTRALKAVDHAALVRVDLATLTVEIEAGSATARQLSDAIRRAGYSPVAA